MPNKLTSRQIMECEARPLFSSQTAPGWGIPDLFQEFMQVYGRKLANLGQGDEPADPVLSGSVAFARTMISIVVEKNGAVKIIKRGHVLVDEDPAKLDSPDLIDTTRDFITTGEILAAFEEEAARLEKEHEEHLRFVAYEPKLIDQRIRQISPEKTAGRNVDIDCSSETSGGSCYRLLIDGQPASTDVTEEFGQFIVDRRTAVIRARENITTKANRLEDLKRRIPDSRQALTALGEKMDHLTDGLKQDELKDKLNGDFVGLTLNDQSQIMAVVSREVNEELAELPAEYKRRLIADHLYGDELPESLQEALKIKGVIWTVDDAIGYHPTDTKPVAEVKTPKTTATNASSAAWLDSYGKKP